MTKIDRDQTPSDLAWVAERLEQDRPTATPLELDSMKLQARSRAARGARSQAKGSVLKSRVAIAAILMLGLFTGGTGTTLALSGDSGSAAQVQYSKPGGGSVLGKQQGPQNDSPENGSVLGQQQSGGGDNGRASSATPSSDSPVQRSRQVVATKGGKSLPFTGLAAVPLIVLGLGLIVVGTMLYRNVRREPTGA